jgi:hypothetical protein
MESSKCGTKESSKLTLRCAIIIASWSGATIGKSHCDF